MPTLSSLTLTGWYLTIAIIIAVVASAVQIRDLILDSRRRAMPLRPTVAAIPLVLALSLIGALMWPLLAFWSAVAAWLLAAYGLGWLARWALDRLPSRQPRLPILLAPRRPFVVVFLARIVLLPAAVLIFYVALNAATDDLNTIESNSVFVAGAALGAFYGGTKRKPMVAITCAILGALWFVFAIPLAIFLLLWLWLAPQLGARLAWITLVSDLGRTGHSALPPSWIPHLSRQASDTVVIQAQYRTGDGSSSAYSADLDPLVRTHFGRPTQRGSFNLWIQTPFDLPSPATTRVSGQEWLVVPVLINDAAPGIAGRRATDNNPLFIEVFSHLHVASALRLTPGDLVTLRFLPGTCLNLAA